MSVNPIEDNSTPKPTGSLEDLFRHHLGEEAAVPPRPMLWDQIDNSLLIRQNETYRRRLAATRWVAAASLLLATLAGTGWWAHRASDMAGTEVATATRARGASATGNANASTGKGGVTESDAAATTDAFATKNAAATSANGSANGSLNNGGSTGNATYAAGKYSVAANSAGRATGFGSASVRNELENGAMASGSAEQPTGANATRNTTASSPAEIAAANSPASIAARITPATSGPTSGLNGNSSRVAAATGATAASVAASSATTTAGSALTGAAAGAPALAALTQASSVAIPEQVGLLASSPASLALPTSATLPDGLALLPAAEPLPTVDVQKWHYGASYTAGVFNPNIDFSRAGIAPEYGYNPALGADSPALTEFAAAQYRENLRPGLSQRLALLATRHLGGHWSLSTGAEFGQATAKSASSAAFVGEQILDLGQMSTGRLRTTNFRYRTAGIPVEVRYTNPVKRGWSLYGRLGGAVTALLGVRSEVEDNPEATRTYSLTSAGTPYRRVLANVRGGVGAQFRPTAGKWALTVGPTAELGLLSLNAHPAQSFMRESRPYGFGVDVAVEFGK
ncbi:PorT family protein [Hymenobacter sp. BT770]|uniref:PorT family protein n=1 Tax=Hymenobacter sp. BT770 TaxID=2886942 RepID=UPI001D116E3C|nr:PorT family protein [Hymenobacter sp. BT770]MCC3151939.1 PorT family protein [Hymenobacter sp. BT770]MDO3413438.1 PorT family protein [Hymenobacter sp. BT770]